MFSTAKHVYVIKMLNIINGLIIIADIIIYLILLSVQN